MPCLLESGSRNHSVQLRIVFLTITVEICHTLPAKGFQVSIILGISTTCNRLRTVRIFKELLVTSLLFFPKDTRHFYIPYRAICVASRSIYKQLLYFRKSSDTNEEVYTTHHSRRQKHLGSKLWPIEKWDSSLWGLPSQIFLLKERFLIGWKSLGVPVEVVTQQPTIIFCELKTITRTA